MPQDSDKPFPAWPASLTLRAIIKRSSPVDRSALAAVLIYCVLLAVGVHRFGSFASFLGFLSFIATIYLILRAIRVMRRHILWRLRNRLIITYLFMAVVPVVLLLSIAGVAGYLLELQIGAHLLQDDLKNRTSILAADTNAIAAALERESDIGSTRDLPPNTLPGQDPALFRPAVANVIAAAQIEWPDIRVLLNRGRNLLPRGTSTQFSGLGEFRGQLWFSSLEVIGTPDGEATVVVVAPVTPGLLDGLPSKLGPVTLTLLGSASPGAPNAISLEGQSYARQAIIASQTRALASAANFLDFRVNGVATLEAYRVDQQSHSNVDVPVLAQYSLRPSAVNRDLFTSVGQVGPVLLEVLGVIVAAFLLIEIVAFVTGVVMTRTITHSVADLYEATTHVRQGDFSHQIRILKRDQLGALASSFNQMTRSISELMEEQRQKQRLEHEVEIAREVQDKLFPRKMPTLEGLDLAAICRPARVVSGDYYDFLQMGPSRIGIALADISGKGLYAALLMASVQAALHTAAALERHPGTAELVTLLNRHLFQNTSEDRYATLFLAIYDNSDRSLTYTNAGHLSPFLVCDGCAYRLDDGGTVVGLFESAEFSEKSIQVPRGSVFVAFSDGLTEIENVYGEEFGVERLKCEVMKRGQLPAAQLAQELVDAAEQWAGSPEQADDITVVVARMA